MAPMSHHTLRALAMFGLTRHDLGADPEGQKRHARRAARFAAQLDRTLPPGAIAVITGPSGSGKTRVLSALARRLDHQVVHVEPFSRYPPATTRVIDVVLAHMPAEPESSSLATALQHLASGGLGDARLFAARVDQLSEGERARLSLVLALARLHPRQSATLIMDEFAAALDDATACGVAAGLRRCTHRQPTIRVVIATHRTCCIPELQPRILLQL